MAPEDRRCVTVVVEGWRSPELARGWTYWVPGYVGPLKKGDWVIVESPRNEKAQLDEQSGIPIFGQVSDPKPPLTIRKKATRWIVGKVEWDPYRALQALAPGNKGDE